jgi:endonuclease YncB( thermonuclease family)
MPKEARARPSHVPAISLFIGLVILAAAIGGAWHAMPRTASSAQVRVIDGDSLRAGSEDIRLVGIDAPELSQTCRDARGRAWPCGNAAKTRLRELVSRGAAACVPRASGWCEKGGAGPDCGKNMLSIPLLLVV